MRLFNKKGLTTSQLFLITEAVLAVLVFASIGVWINNVAGNIEFERSFMARDVGLLLDTIYASPGNVSVQYTTKLDQKSVSFFSIARNTTFTASFAPSRVHIFANQTTQEFPKTYYFGRDQKIVFLETIGISNQFVMKKIHSDLIIESSSKTGGSS